MPFSTLPAGTRPADHCWSAETAFHHRALALRERRLSAIGPGEHFGAVVGGEDDDGIIVDTHVLELLHDDADVVVELRHAGFMLVSPFPGILSFAHGVILFLVMHLKPTWLAEVSIGSA
jgi:hypothetical protein